ncbi:MAG: TrmH family RNA methyltransferase [Actinomycetota bacterium]
MRAEPGVITSAANPLVKRLRKLRHRKQREREGAFVVEGIAQVWRAVEHGADVEALVVAPELLTSERAWRLVAEESAAGTMVVQLERGLFEDVTERDHPSGLAAIVRVHERALSEIDPTTASVFVVLDGVGNPGNLGSIIRSVDAAGRGAVVVVGESTDQYHPSAVKASMGALFTVPVVRARTMDEVFRWASEHGVGVIGTSARAPVSCWDVRYEPPLMLVFGSEAMGLSPEVLARARTSVRIPMDGEVSSLNLAVAVGMVLYEVKRQLQKP